MGYTTTFDGSVSIDPPLNEQEIEFLTKFSESRRMNRKNGPYFVDGEGYRGQSDDSDVIDFNSPPDGQPGLWCQWIPTENGCSIVWDEGEKFYDSVEWMQYLIDHFLKPGAIAKDQLPFLQANHICNGMIDAEGEEYGDLWRLVVKNNKVSVKRGRVVYND